MRKILMALVLMISLVSVGCGASKAGSFKHEAEGVTITATYPSGTKWMVDKKAGTPTMRKGDNPDRPRFGDPAIKFYVKDTNILVMNQFKDKYIKELTDLPKKTIGGVEMKGKSIKHASGQHTYNYYAEVAPDVWVWVEIFNPDMTEGSEMSKIVDSIQFNTVK